MNAKPARNLQEVTSSQPALKNLQIRTPPGLQQPIATYRTLGPVHCLRAAQSCQSATAAACAFFPQGEPASHPLPTTAPKVTKPASSLQGPSTRPAPELPTPHQVRVLAISLGYGLTDKASHDASLSLAYLILFLVRTRHLVAAHLNSPPHLKYSHYCWTTS